MNKKQILASLNKIAYELENNNLHNEAQNITNLMIKLSAHIHEHYDDFRFKDDFEEDNAFYPELEEELSTDGPPPPDDPDFDMDLDFGDDDINKDTKPKWKIVDINYKYQ